MFNLEVAKEAKVLLTLGEGLPFIVAGGGGGSLKTGRFITTKANQGDLLTTLLACMGVPVDRPIGIATKQIREMING